MPIGGELGLSLTPKPNDPKNPLLTLDEMTGQLLAT